MQLPTFFEPYADGARTIDRPFDARGEASSIAAGEKEQPPQPTLRPLALVADDDPDVLAICALVLESEGYRVTATDDGRKAVALMNESPDLDVILLDVMMPRLDGLSVCKIAKSNPRTRHVPVIIMSASETLRDKGAGCSADAVLPKPFDIDRLVDTVQQLTSGVNP